VRGNGKIIQELEAIFRGCGWNVLKVLWGGDWDPLFERDRDGLLERRLAEVVDGEAQKAGVEGGAYMRKRIFGTDPRLLDLVKHLSDEQLWKMRLGGHDPDKVYAAFKRATEHQGSPTVILARTIKGYGLGEAGEGRNVTHQQKKLDQEELLQFKRRFDIPIDDAAAAEAKLYRPPDDSPELVYLRDRRRGLGGWLPRRVPGTATLKAPGDELFREFAEGTAGRPVSTTMALVRILTKLLHDKDIGRHVVPIVPDEARTFGMEALFRQVGIYSHPGQLYEPVDSASVLFYKEARDGQILEEGITEAGSMSSFIAAGTAYANYGVPTIPFFIYYSMFGFQRIGDLAWAAGDMGARGFMIGGTAGRTTLAGEGLQHQDGHSHVLALPVPNLVAYDAAFAFELGVIVQDGIRRMFEQRENVFYYLTVGNEAYAQPPMPEGAREGILRGVYRFSTAPIDSKLKVQLIGSGAILNEVIKAQRMLAERFGVAADVWSATSYKELRRDGLEVERQNLLHPERAPQVPYVARTLGQASGPFVAASDYMKVLPDSIARWLPRPLLSLGTDGFGRSEDRAGLRDFFEVDARYIAVAALSQLARNGQFDPKQVTQAIRELQIDPEKVNPALS
jgi:pyruvate dehydrogenase E1 component